MSTVSAPQSAHFDMGKVYSDSANQANAWWSTPGRPSDPAPCQYNLNRVRMSPELIEHFRNPRNVGELPAPAITVEVSNPICGDILRLSARIESGLIVQTGFKVRGCTASIAAGSALTEIICGRNRAGLKSLETADVDSAVGGLANESKHAAVLCLDAVRALLAQFPV